MNTIYPSIQRRVPWNSGKLRGQKAPLRLRDIWAIRIRLQLAKKIRDLALFDLAIDSKLRACDLVKLRVRDVGSADHMSSRTIVLQQKTQRLSSLKSPRRREMQFPLGLNRLSFNPTPICFQAGSTTRTIFRLGNMHESSIYGSQESL
jgi:hypothetical protein